MNNSFDRKNGKGGGNNSSHGFRKRTKGKGSWKNHQNNHRFKKGDRHFQKFVDTEHENGYESNHWPQNDWNCGNNRINDYHFNESAPCGGIYPWIRNKPASHLIIPQHINFDEQTVGTRLNRVANNIEAMPQREPESIEMKKELDVNREMNVPKNDNMVVTKPHSEAHQPLEYPVTSNESVKIKQEKDIISLIQKKKSSSSESSSSEDEPEQNIKATVPIKPEITSTLKSPSSPLNIKLKPRTNSVSSTPVKITEKCIPTSSSSSSSDEEDSLPPSEQKPEKRIKPQTFRKSESKNRKISSEEDVVCVGNLENKIVLEDESDKSSADDEPENETVANIFNELSKKSEKQIREKCMICDKKGHTSFQCQMICKNCSTPYHGYRTCPHPANLNTMLQLFIEFCMQQLQNFQLEKQSTSSNYNVPKPKIETSHLTSVVNKSKLKRKQVKTNETNKKRKSSKKRKVSTSKKTKSKANSDEDNEDSCDMETSSTGTDEHISDSSAKSLISSKKKRKLKNVNASKAALDLSSFSANSVGLPMVLNSFPHLTVPTTSIHNPNTSTNALNTLLLTQMFQNAIGSLKK